MARKLRVGVLFGGRSGEHEVSLMSAASVIEAIDKDKYEVVPIGIAKSGKWLMSDDVLRVLKSGAGEDAVGSVYIPANPRERALFCVGESARRRKHKLDVVIPILHGPFGEDGTVQGLLELADIPYVGAGVLASAVGMDKAVMKILFRHAGLPVMEFRAYKRSDWRRTPQSVMDSIEADLGYPCFVKPACLGSSVGISKVHNRNELSSALDEAAQYDRKLIVEDAAEGYREVECSVLGNDEPIASIPGEIVPSREFYDYEAKYVDEGSQLYIPARLPATAIERVRELAVVAFKSIDCCGMARVDFFVSQDGSDVIVNEINTIPGFTRISMYPKLWEASGLSMTALMDKLIELALERHADKASSRTSYRD